MTQLGTSRWKRHQVALLVVTEETDEDEESQVITEFGRVARSWSPLANGWDKLTYRQVDTIVPVGLDELIAALSTRQREAVRIAASQGGILTPAVTNAMLERFAALSPESIEALRELLTEQPARTSSITGLGLQVAAQEADAVSTALEMAGFPRAELGTTRPDGAVSFVERLAEVRLREDPAINYDAGQFLDFDRIEFPAGVVEFRHEDESLVVINVNRQPLEHTTGADLIYLNETAHSLVLVQYKTFDRAGTPSTLVYRPDDQLEAELARMRAIEPGRSASGVDGFRFNPVFCYLKFCDPVTTLNRQAGRMVKGFYLPIDYYDLLIKSDLTKGPRGGRSITYDNVPSKMTSETFTGLVRGGWIGTQGATTRRLTDLVLAGLAADRSQTVAVASKINQDDDQPATKSATRLLRASAARAAGGSAGSASHSRRPPSGQ